jgi:omega-6 fatty acid desaturase (delta-12 desaturase)
MNRQKYLEIRDRFKLDPDSNALALFWIQTGTLITLGVTILSFFEQSRFALLAIPFFSVVMFRSFSLMHDASHGLVSKNSAVNRSVGIISGTFCFLAFDTWRSSHLEHHRWGGNIDRDPVAAMIKVFPNFPAPLRGILSLGWRCWVPTLALLQISLFWVISLRQALTQESSFGHRFGLLVPFLFWATVFTLTPLHLTWMVLVPSIILYQIGVEVMNAPHHLGLNYVRGDVKIPAWEQFRISRSCIYPGWLAKFVVLNFNYHTEHHMYPYVPWYHLDKLHDTLKLELGSAYNSDPSFAWIMRNRTKDLAEVYDCPDDGITKVQQAA